MFITCHPNINKAFDYNDPLPEPEFDYIRIPNFIGQELDFDAEASACIVQKHHILSIDRADHFYLLHLEGVAFQGRNIYTGGWATQCVLMRKKKLPTQIPGYLSEISC